MVKDTSSVLLVKKKLKDGLLELLKVKSIGKINASELCGKAEINFKTYFAHYSKPQDVLLDMERDMVKEMEEILEKLADNPQKVNDKEICQHLYDHVALLRTLVRGQQN